MFNIGMPELIVILIILLLVFGATRLPSIARALGKSLGEFKKGLKEEKGEGAGDKKEEFSDQNEISQE